MDIRSLITPAPKSSGLSRRAMLRAAGCGFGYLGLQSLMAGLAQAEASVDPLIPKPPMFPARAKRVIFLFMHGGPSSIDILDPKPYLDANDGKPLPIKQPLTFAAGKDCRRLRSGLLSTRFQRLSREVVDSGFLPTPQRRKRVS